MQSQTLSHEYPGSSTQQGSCSLSTEQLSPFRSMHFGKEGEHVEVVGGHGVKTPSHVTPTFCVAEHEVVVEGQVTVPWAQVA